MKEPTHEERAAYAAVDDALRTYPLAAPPPYLLDQVMERLEVASPAPTPRFRLTWLDYALSLLAASVVGVALVLWRLLPPQVAARAQGQLLLLAQGVNPQILVVALVGALALVAVALFASAALFERQPPTRPR